MRSVREIDFLLHWGFRVADDETLRKVLAAGKDLESTVTLVLSRVSKLVDDHLAKRIRAVMREIKMP